MYTCAITVYFAGCPGHVIDTIKAIPPLLHFTHAFTAENGVDTAKASAADVILAGPDLETDVYLALSDAMRADAELVLLAQRERVLPAALLARVADIWRMPMPDDELRFHFARWQERFKQGKDLWESQQFLECTLNTAPNLIWFKDREGVHELVNASFCHAVNKSREQVQGQRHAYIWDVEADDPACIESERIVMESGRTHTSEETIETGAGQRLLITYKSPLRNVDGSMMGTMGVAVDVTQEQLYREELLRNNAALEAMFTSMDCGILCHSPDGTRIININRAALDLLGFSSLDEMQSGGFRMVASTVMDEDKPRLRAAIGQLKKVGDSTSYEYRVEHADGKRLHVVGSAKLVEKDGEIVCQRFLLDCTAQKLKEEKERSEKERRQKDLVSALCVDYQLVCVLDPDARDDNVLQLMEYPDQNLGRIFSADMPFPQRMENYIRTCVHPDDRDEFRQNILTLRNKLAHEQIHYFSYRALDGGDIRYFRLKAVRAGEPNEPYSIIIGLQSVDTSTRNEMEQKRRLGEALKQAKRASTAKSIFLSNMSHDIRTPMNAVLGYASLALTHLDKRDQVEGFLKKILSSGSHLVSLINDILDMSYIESGKIQLEEAPCELPVLLHELWNIVQPAADAKKQNLTIETENIRDEYVYCDKLRLNQALLNLLSNSIKYTDEGGSIDMRITQEDFASPGHASFIFRIRDNGIGMSEDFLARIFEPFERAQTSTVAGIQGTGLGMSITKNIVEMMKGDISVQSKPNAGTEFTLRVTFRLADDERARHDPDALANRAALVVDANRSSGENTARLLRGRGLRVDVADTAKDALRIFGQQADGYGLCIIDKNLPDGDGATLARHIADRAGTRRPRMLLTCATWAGTLRKPADDAIDACLGKPLFWSDVRDCLQPPAAVEASGKPDKRRSARKGRILLAEDNAINQEIAKEFLTEAGYTVEVACNGQEAVQMLTESTPGYYDVILMDVQMPVLDGYGATKRIRELKDARLASIPIVALTANSFEEDKREALMHGMNEHIAKPLDFNILFSTLDRIFGMAE